MRVLSKAFGRLKLTLPWVPPDTKLSKLDTLRLATSYIGHLQRILDDDSAVDREEDEEKPQVLGLVSSFLINFPGYIYNFVHIIFGSRHLVNYFWFIIRMLSAESS